MDDVARSVRIKPAEYYNYLPDGSLIITPHCMAMLALLQSRVFRVSRVLSITYFGCHVLF